MDDKKAEQGFPELDTIQMITDLPYSPFIQITLVCNSQVYKGKNLEKLLKKIFKDYGRTKIKVS